MRRTTKTSVGLAVGMTMSMGLAGSTQEMPKVEPRQITTVQRTGYDQQFKAVEEYWTQRGVKGLGQTSIKYVSGKDVSRCGYVYTTHSGGSSNYCPPNNTITMTARDVTRFDPGTYTSLFITGHEYGHRVQDATDQLLAKPPQAELGATCLAGVFMIEKYPVHVLGSLVNDALSKTAITTVVGGSDYLHGTVEQQQRALAVGITTRNCEQYGVDLP